LAGTSIGGSLFLRDATVKGDILLSEAEIGDSMDATASNIINVNSRDLRVDKNFYLTGAIIAGRFDAEGLQVGRDLFMDNAAFGEPIGMRFARVGANLDLSGTGFPELALFATRIEGELRLTSNLPLASERPEVARRLNLGNAYAGALRVARNGRQSAWPSELELGGFTYDRLDELKPASNAAAASGDMLDRDVNWYIDEKTGWLSRDRTFSPQPYVHLADVFRRAGEPEKANQVLYAGRERERQEATGWLQWMWLTVLKWTIGYGVGLGYFLSVIWILLLTTLGAGIIAYGRSRGLIRAGELGDIQSTARGQAGDMLNRLAANMAYSLDELLPIITLDPAHDKAKLKGSVKYYFMLHRLLGFLLGTFILAGLAGLTQK
jgi:hypothetical protein